MPADAPAVPMEDGATVGVFSGTKDEISSGRKNELFSVGREELPSGGEKAVPSGAGEQVKLPVLMYHSVLRSRKGVYVVSPAQLEADLAALCRAGYTPVRAEAVIAYA